MGDKRSRVAPKHTFDKIARRIAFEFVFLDQGMEDKCPALDLMRYSAFFFQAAKQCLDRAVGNRLLIEKHGYAQCTPRNDDPTIQEEPWIDFSSGYVQRAMHKFPKQGSKKPWKLHQSMSPSS